MERIPVAGPWVTDKEVQAVAEAAANAWFDNANTYQQRFEERFAAYVGRRFAVALPSCTSALHLALLALGVGPGDEVVVPECTWIATAAPVCYVGATPVFADIDEVSWCLSPASFRAAITPRTRAVIPVDLYGNMPEMDELLAVAAEHGIAVVEDAAEAIGSTYRGRKAGAFGDASVFSFHGSKTLTTGEGGMLVTDSPPVHERALVLRDHGRWPGDVSFFNREVGHKYKMSAFQAAFGLAQLERVEELVARKRQLFAWYERELDGVGGLRLNAQPAHVENSYWMVTAVLDDRYPLDKEALGRALAQAGIDSRPFFHPLSSIPAFRDRPRAAGARRRNTTAYRVSRAGINLPSALTLTEGQVVRVAGALRGALAACLAA